MNTKSLLLVALAVLAVPMAVAQTGNDAFRLGQRQPLSSAQFMGSAGVGVAGRGDIGDLFGNPAGLGLLNRGALSISLNASNVENDAVYSAGGGPASASISELSGSRLGSVAYAYKFPTAQGSLVVGAGIAQVASFNRSLGFEGENSLNSFTDFLMPLSDEFDLISEGSDVFPEFSRTLSFIGFETYAIDLDQDGVASGDAVPFIPAVTTGTVLQSGLVEEEGQMHEFTVGGAVEAARDVMVGVSVNVPYGRYRFTRILDEDDIYDDNNGDGGTTDFAFLTFNEAFESRMVGINLRAGLTAKVAPNVRVGLSLETPTYYSVSEDYDTILFTSFDNGDAFEYGDDADEDAGRGSFDYEVITPWRLGAGVAFDMGELTLAADLEFVDWSQMELDSQTFSFADQNLAIRQNFEATTSLRLGATYRMDKFHLRGGIWAQPDPRADAGYDRDRGAVSLGMSYLVNSQFALDIGVMAEVFEDRYAPYTEVADAPLVSEDVTRSYFTIGVRMGL